MTGNVQPSSSKMLFLKEFIRNPRMVGSIIPTSGVAVRALLGAVDWQRTRCVVEYGPGTGVFTTEILRRMGPDARLIAIDTNPMFVELLRQQIRDPRLISVEGSAADVEQILARHGFAQTDYIVSGLPFSVLPPGGADAIMDASYRAIAPGGAFLIYQYSLFVLPYLQKRFDRVRSKFILRCIPPARLFWAWKNADSVKSAAAENLVAA